MVTQLLGFFSITFIVNGFINLSRPNAAHIRSLQMINNEDIRVEMTKQSAKVILRAFQLLKAKVKYWADLHNYTKENYYYERVADYIVAKKNFRLLKK